MNHPLKVDSPPEWLESVIENFNEFLIDHAANERKASAVAMSMIAHYPNRTALLEAMVDLAVEELNHYRQVLKLMIKRGVTPAPDEKDPYVNKIVSQTRRGERHYFLDRLLTAAVIEARGAERFELLANRLKDADLAAFYHALAKSEENHHHLFLTLAKTYFPIEEVENRWLAWRDIEAEVMTQLTIRPRLH